MLEIAIFRTREGQAKASVEAYRGVASILTDAEGSRGASLHRGVEDPGSFRLIVEWTSFVEAHMALTQQQDFGESVGPYLAGQPEVRYVEAVA